MKKTIAGAVLLTLLFIGALFNAGYQKSVLSGLIEIIDTADAQMASGDLSAAFGTLSGAIDAWDDWEEYTHIFIRHTDVESVSAAFYELLSDLCAHENEYHVFGETLIPNVPAGLSSCSVVLKTKVPFVLS